MTCPLFNQTGLKNISAAEFIYGEFEDVYKP
jgi:hypothetical protein